MRKQLDFNSISIVFSKQLSATSQRNSYKVYVISKLKLICSNYTISPLLLFVSCLLELSYKFLKLTKNVCKLYLLTSINDPIILVFSFSHWMQPSYSFAFFSFQQIKSNKRKQRAIFCCFLAALFPVGWLSGLTTVIRISCYLILWRFLKRMLRTVLNIG